MKGLNRQLEEYFEVLLSKYQCSFQKAYSIINPLIQWLKNGENPSTKVVPLSSTGWSFQSFWLFAYELVITKLHANAVDIPSLKLLHPYLTKRKQRLKSNGMYSSWSEIIFVVPQGSILGLLLFKIFLSDKFQFFPDRDITNYADDNTLYSIHKLE